MDPGSSFGRWRVHVIVTVGGDLGFDFNILSESHFENDILSEIHHAGTSGQVKAAQALLGKVPKQYKKFSK